VRLRERLLERVALFTCRHPWLVLGLAAALTAFSLVVAAFRGRVSTDLADVLPRHSKEAALYVEVAERFAADMLLVALESEDPQALEEARPFFERLAPRLAALEDPGFPGRKLVRSVEYRSGEMLRKLGELVEERGYLYLDEEDIGILGRKLTTEAIAEQMAENRRRLETAGAEFFARRIRPDPLDLFELLQRKRVRAGGQFASREGDDFIVSPDGRLALMVVQATGPVKDLAFDKRLMALVEGAERQTWEELEREDPARWNAIRSKVRLGHAGGYAIAVNENRVLSEDIAKSFATSLVGVLVLFSLGFRRFGALVYVGVPLVASVVWAVAVAFLAFGHVSVMSGGFAAILVGLSVDYAIHVYNSYVSSRARGEGVQAAVTGAVVSSGSGIFFSALTTAVAFFAIMFTRFRGLAEFGCLSGLGVLFGLAAMLFVLPAMLIARNRIRPEPVRAVRAFGWGLEFVARAILARPAAVFAASAVLALASALYVYSTMTVYFFDSDFASIRAQSEVYDLGERIQRKFGTNLGAVFALSRGSTEDEALERASEVLRRAEALRSGRELARSDWPASGQGGGAPFVRVRGARVRVRRAEIVLPEGFDGALADGAELLERPDGSRLAVYSFRSKSELADWVVEGRGRLFSGVELEPGSALVWRRGVRDAVEATFSVWFLGKAEVVEMGLGSDAVVARGARAGGFTWPPEEGDQVRLTLEGDPSRGLRLVAGRGTIMSVDSLVRFVPPRAAQEASARFVASIDVDRVASDIASSARSNGLRPEAFDGFVERLRRMVERARSPSYVTLAEVARGEFAPLLSKYVHRAPQPSEEGKRFAIATYLFPERGELPRAWYERVRSELAPAAEFTAPRLVSLEVRDIVYEDFSWITSVVFGGVALALFWSFGSVVWSVVSLLPVFSGVAMMLATMLLVGHGLNFVNVLIFPIIIGIGIDYGIHVVHRYLDRAGVRSIIVETGRAFMLTSLTTMIGFGSLVTSRYRGLWSLGVVSVLGMLFCLYASLIALPAMLAALERRAEEKP